MTEYSMSDVEFLLEATTMPQVLGPMNPNGELGGDYWTGAGVTTYSSEFSTAQLFPLRAGGVEALAQHMTFVGNTASGTTVYSEPVMIQRASRYTNYNVGFTAFVGTWNGGGAVTIYTELLDANYNLLATSQNYGQSYTSGTDYGYWRVKNSMIMWVSGAVYCRLKFVVSEVSGAWKFSTRGVIQADWQPFGGSNAFPYSPGDFVNWNALPHELVTAYSIRRGSRPNPPVDQLEIGSLNIRAKGNWEGSLIRKNRAIRLRVKKDGRYITLFKGRIDTFTRETYPDTSLDRIEIVAVDAVKEMAETPQAIVSKGNMKQRVDSVMTAYFNDNLAGTTLYDHIIYSVKDTSGIQATGTLINTEAAVLDQLLTIRNTERGLLYVDRLNTVRAVARNDIPAWASPMVFKDINVAAGQYKIMVGGFDFNQANTSVANRITVKVRGVGASTGNDYEVAYGPYSSSETVGVTGDLNIAGPAESAMETARKYIKLYVSTGETRTVEHFRWDATDDWATAATMEIYDPVQVVFSRGSYMLTDYRVLALEHEITPKRWVTTVSTRPREMNYTDSRDIRGYGGHRAPAAETLGPDGRQVVIPS